MRPIRGLLAVTGAMALALAALGLAALVWAPRWLVVADELRPAEAIVTLNGATLRAVYAAELYHRGLAPTIWVGRPEFDPPQALVDLGLPFRPQEEDYCEVLRKKGVPDAAVRLFGHGHVSTVEEAEALRQTLGPGPHTLILVTASFHSRRAKAAFASAFPGSTLLLAPDPLEPLPEAWWRDRKAALNVVQETAKTLHFILGGVFRSTDGATGTPDEAAGQAKAAARP